MFGSIGFPELMLIFIVVLLVFGPKKLPEFAKLLGKTIREFRSTVDEAKAAIEDEIYKNDMSVQLKDIGTDIKDAMNIYGKDIGKDFKDARNIPHVDDPPAGESEKSKEDEKSKDNEKSE
jgi:TatA/E family protein of Tat protein translocase